MMKNMGLARLGVAVGILYWPAEALIHDFIFGNGHFIDNLFSPDVNEIWMRLLISITFMAFGWYAQRAVEDHQQMQSQIQAKSKRLQQIIDSSYDAYVSMDPDGLITGWNHSAEVLFGWPLQRILGQPVTTIIPERLRESHIKGMAHYQRESIGAFLYKPVMTQALHRDGFEFSIEIVITPIKSDGVQEFFAFIREQTAER